MAKGAFGLLGAILIGALGSGVWQSWLGPVLHSLRNWILDFASLGYKGFKDGVYVRIALDDQSAMAAATLDWITTVTCLSLGFLTGYIMAFFNGEVKAAQRAYDRLKQLNAPKEPAAARDETAKRLDNVLPRFAANVTLARRMRIAIFAIALFNLTLVAGRLVSGAKVSYIVSADAHYHQVFRLVSPYVDAHEQALVESEFAQISSRDGYVKVVSRLETQCQAHGIAVPKFDPW